MYRLLIISRKQATQEMFANMTQEDLGDFKAPHFRQDYQGAMECLKNHAIDAVAFDDEDTEFYQYLSEKKPDIPIFMIANNLDEQKERLCELDRLLIKLHADNVNNFQLYGNRMEKERYHWVRRVLGGLETTEEEMIRHSYLYRCSRRLHTPFWFFRFSIPENDEFISERWHYGSDRLETALANFFGKEYEGMRIHIAVVSPQEVRLACFPTEGNELMTKKQVQQYIQKTLEHVDYYLGLKMVVEDIQKIPGFIAFSK